MALDRINFDIGGILDGSGSPTRMVGTSQLEEAFQEKYGEGIPQDERAAELSASLFQSLAQESTTQFVAMRTAPAREALPILLDLVEPTVRDTRAIGGLIEKELSDRESYGLTELPETLDLTYMLSAFTVSTYVIAPELGLQHPAMRPEPELAIERPDVKKSTPSAHAAAHRRGLARMMADRTVDRKDQRRLVMMRQRGERILFRLVAFDERLTALRADEAESDPEVE